MTANHSRTLMIGLDGMDLTLIEQWVRQGHLPFLGELLSSGHLQRTRPLSLPGSEWVNLATGTSAGQHTYVHQTQLRPNSYDLVPFHSSQVTCQPFYATLSAAGHRCVVIDMQVDRPVHDFNGVQVIDWGTEFQLAEFTTNPPDFRNELLQRFGVHVFTELGPTRADDQGLTLLRAKLEEGIKRRTALAQFVAKREAWDLCFMSFCECHKAGHFFWKLFDSAHPEHRQIAEGSEHWLRELYALTDSAIQEVVTMLSPLNNLIIVADRGMQPEYRGDHLLAEILQRLELLKLTSLGRQSALRSDMTAARSQPSSFRRRIRSLARLWLPSSLKPLAKRALGIPLPDWSKTRAFTLPNVGNSYIRINLKGREPEGIVEPGHEYGTLLDILERELYALINPATGQCAVEHVSFPGRLYPGRFSADLPDVSILWKAERPIQSLTSDSIGIVIGEPTARRSGNHRAEGFWLASGEDFRTGATAGIGDLRQVAPTVLAIYNVQLPANYELPPCEAILAKASSDVRMPLMTAV